METKQIFATRTKTLRKERGLSQTELAAALDISRTSVNLYESASRVPDITALARYASFFSVTSDYLLGLSENRTNETAAIGDKLGLSDESIERLGKWQKTVKEAPPRMGLIVSRYEPDYKTAVKRLYSTNELINAPEILKIVYDFLTNEIDEWIYPFDSMGDDEDSVCMNDDMITERFEINQAVTMYRLQKELIKLRDKNHDTGDDTTNDKEN